MTAYGSEPSREEFRKEQKMRSNSFYFMGSALCVVLCLAMMFSYFLISQAMDGSVVEPEPEIVTIQLMTPDNFSGGAMENEARKHRDAVVTSLTSLGFEWSNQPHKLTIIKDERYYEVIQPKVEEVMAEYRKQMAKLRP